MDDTEAHALKFLQSLNMGEVCYEPGGNAPPDFLIDGRIAVEVRRLNLHHFSGNDADGLENVSYSLLGFFKNLCVESGPPHDRSYFITWSYRRPLAITSQLKRSVRSYLAELDFDSPLARNKFEIDDCGLSVRILPATQPLEMRLRIGGFHDFDATGWIGAQYSQNIEYVCSEKSRKIAPYKSRHPQWWLVLPVFIWPDIDHEGLGGISSDLCERFGFDRIILVSLRDPESYIAI